MCFSPSFNENGNENCTFREMSSEKETCFDLSLDIPKAAATPTQRRGGGFLNIGALAAVQSNQPKNIETEHKPDDFDDFFGNLPPIGEKPKKPALTIIPPRRIKVGKPSILNFDAIVDDDNNHIVDTFIKNEVKSENPTESPNYDSTENEYRSDPYFNMTTEPADSSATMPNTPINDQNEDILFPPLPNDFGKSLSNHRTATKSTSVSYTDNQSLPPPPPKKCKFVPKEEQITSSATIYEPIVQAKVTPVTPEDIFERNFELSIERGLSSFKRNVVRDVSSAFVHSTTQFEDGTIENFITDLVSGINSVVQTPQKEPINPDFTLSQVSKTFEDGTGIVKKILIDDEAHQKQLNERKTEDLMALQTTINDVKQAFENFTKSTIQVLDKEQHESAMKNNGQQIKSRALERKSRTLKLKRKDLDSRLSHQKVEHDSVESFLKQIEEKRREIEENKDGEETKYIESLRHEVDQLQSELTDETRDRIQKAINECWRDLKTLSHKLEDDLHEMEISEKWAMTQLRNMAPRKITDHHTYKPRTLVKDAQQQLLAKKKQSEIAMKAFTENMDILGIYDLSNIQKSS